MCRSRDTFSAGKGRGDSACAAETTRPSRPHAAAYAPAASADLRKLLRLVESLSISFIPNSFDLVRRVYRKSAPHGKLFFNTETRRHGDTAKALSLNCVSVPP